VLQSVVAEQLAKASLAYLERGIVLRRLVEDDLA